MKCKIITKDLLKELKEVFAEKVSNTIDEVQLHQVGNDIVLARSYVTKKSLRNVTKTCTFAYDFIEPLAKTMKLNCHERFLKWIKNAYDIETFLLTLNEDNCRATIEYKTPMGEGCVEFTMDHIDKEIPIDQPEQIDISSMKDFANNSRPYVYFDNGVMMATDGYIMKLQDTDIDGTFAVSLDGDMNDKERIPNYKAIIPKRDAMEFVLNITDRKNFIKLLKFWLKEYKKTLTNKRFFRCGFWFETSADNKLYVCKDLKDGVDRRHLGSCSVKEEYSLNFGYEHKVYHNVGTLIKVAEDLTDKEFTIYATKNSGNIIHTEHSLYLIMPISVESYSEGSMAKV